MKKKAIILGAGPIGLITSWLLAEKNWDVQLYEKENLVGGLCRTWKWKGIFLDTGPHIFHTSDAKMWNFWKKIFKKKLIKGTYWSKNLTKFDDKYSFVDYPLSKEGLNKLPKKFKKKIKYELKSLNFSKNNLATNFEQYIQNQVGPTLQKLFFKEYPEKVWGLSTDKMTAEWAPKRIKFTNKSEPFFINEFTGVGKYGTGDLYEIIKNKILKLGGKIHLKHKVKNFTEKGSNITEIVFNNKKKISIKKDDIIISSLPITLTSRFLGYKSNLKFRGIRSVYIKINKTKCLPKKINWVYVSNKNIIFNRVTEPKKMSKFLCEKNTTFLCVEISYSKNDNIDKSSFNEIKNKVIDGLINTNLIKSQKEIIDVCENKEDFVYPVQFVNYKKELSKTKSIISKYHQLYSLGTGGDFDYADSQILFNKSFDLVSNLNDKFNSRNITMRPKRKNKLNQHVKLGNKYVGKDFPTYIIAEGGLNHNGDIQIAKKLIDQAKKINCNAIKFQTFSKNSRVSNKVKFANYVEKADGLREDLNEIFNKNKLHDKEIKNLFKYAKKKKIEIFSTPFDTESLKKLEKIGVNFYKLASVDIVNLPLIKEIGNTGKPLIMSTGMSDLSRVLDAVEAFRETGNKNLILLHCLSSYPAESSEMNLNCIKSLKDQFKIPVGLSDHFPGIEISLMAIGVGANIIERHFTLDKRMEGPDHILSSEPNDMKLLVECARKSNLILGDGEKIIQPSEFEVINSQLKSIYARKNIKKGKALNIKDIIIKGPSGGILPKYLDLLIGKKINKNISKDHPINWTDF